MKFEIYCDESNPDALTSKKEHAKYLLIGSLWLPAEIRQDIKDKIKQIKEIHKFKTEIKWHKVHKDKDSFYTDLVGLFFEYGDSLRFRCVVVESDKVDLVKFHDNDQELGFYKFYYQVLQHWILPFNAYSIFCDEKSNRQSDRLKILKEVLNCTSLSSTVDNIQALPSKESVLIQLTDFLLGMASSRLNESINPNSYKDVLIKKLEKRLGLDCLKPTGRRENKFNIFQINLQGGW